MARIQATAEESETPIIYSTDSHRPPPTELRSAFLQIAARESRENGTYANVWFALAQATKEMQVFDFGVIDDNKLIQESNRGAGLYLQDHLRMPFRSVLYWYNAILDPARMRQGIIDAGGSDAWTQPTIQRYATVAIDADAVGICPKGTRAIVACDFIDMDCDPDLRFARQQMEPSPRYRKAFLLAATGYFKVLADPSNDAKWIGNELRGTPKNDHIAKASMGSLGDGVLGLTMMVATRGIPMKIEEPSAKLNAKRARSGKEPLVRVTHVDARTYYEAMANTAKGGHHASPVPHLRRGHIRRIGESRTTWVRDCIVNCRSPEEARARDHYEVQT